MSGDRPGRDQVHVPEGPEGAARAGLTVAVQPGSFEPYTVQKRRVLRLISSRKTQVGL